MTILSITTDVAGQIDVEPRLVRIKSNASLATLLSLNYLEGANKFGYQFKYTDQFVISYGPHSSINGMFTAVKTLSTITLQPFMPGNIIPFNITAGEAALASAGKVTLIQSYGTQQFQILSLMTNSGGTNFSGGSGNRLGQITDGTTVYSVIPATNLQTLGNFGWGISTQLPYPASAPANTPTAAGANLYFSYSGGTTDYTAGSIVLTGLALRVA